MKTIGNILWVVCGGFLWAVLLVLEGLLLCLTIIFIPVGVQLFKAAGYVLWPFGQTVRFSDSAGSLLLNIIWIILGGFTNAVGLALTGALWFITIIGIPFSLPYFQLAKFMLMPFGAAFVPTAE